MTARRPRRLGFHLVTVLAVLLCVAAARWQWERAYRTADEVLPDTPVVAIAELDPQTATAGMRVSASGHFDPDHQILVQPRLQDGQTGAWVLTPLIPDAEASGSSGSDGQLADVTAVAIVRGWIPAGGPVPVAPPGRVSVIGVLVSDVRRPGTAAQGDPPTMTTVDTGALAVLAGYPVRSGWLALQSLDPLAADQPVPLAVSDLPGADVGLNWRNAAYAVQWIVFAGFVVFFWTRFRRDLDVATRQQENIR